MKKLDREGVIEWLDIARDHQALDAAGVSYSQAMARLHVVDERGQLQTGVRAFIVLWKRLPGYRFLALLVENVPGLLPVLEYCYRLFARYRLHLTGRRADGEDYTNRNE